MRWGRPFQAAAGLLPGARAEVKTTSAGRKPGGSLERLTLHGGW
jgi:hypothetical protein